MAWPVQMVQLTTVTLTLLTLLVIVVAFYDLRERRIPNFLVFPAMLLGLLLHLILGSGWAGRTQGARGILAGFLLLLLPYAVGGMKAGDVKFLMAIGALAGWEATFRVLLAAVLFYPVMALFYVVRERKLGLTWLRFRRVFWSFLGFFAPGFRLYALRLEGLDTTEIASVRTPFGVSLAVGTLIVLWSGKVSLLLHPVFIMAFK